MMRTLVLFSEYYYPSIGGAQAVVRNLAEEFAKEGSQVYVITSGRSPEKDVHNGVIIYRFPVFGNAAKGIKGNLDPVQKLIDFIKPDAIFVYALQTWFADAVISDLIDISQIPKKIIVPCGLSCLASPVRRLIYASYLKILKTKLWKFDVYVFHAKGRDYRFLNKVIDRLQHTEMVIIPNSVPGDFRVFTMPEAAGVLREKGLEFLFEESFILNVSGHYKIKGHARLVRWYKHYFKDFHYLVIAANNPQSGRSCEKSCERVSRKDRRVVIIDGKDRRLIFALYSMARFFFLSSYIEYAPLVLLEAQQSGLPFLTTNVGNAGELKGGYVWPTRRSERKKVVKIMKDREMLRQLAEEGKRAAHTIFSRHQVLRAYKEIFEGSEIK